LDEDIQNSDGKEEKKKKRRISKAKLPNMSGGNYQKPFG